MERPLFRQSLETQALVKLLGDKDHPDVFTYEEMSKAAGTDVIANRNCIGSARRVLLREKQLVFESIPKVGIKRSSDVEIVEGGSKDIARIRNTARRAIKKGGCVRKFAELPKDKQVQHNLQMSAAGLLYHATTTSAQNKIEKQVTTAMQSLPVAETLAALTNGK